MKLSYLKNKQFKKGAFLKNERAGKSGQDKRVAGSGQDRKGMIKWQILLAPSDCSQMSTGGTDTG